MARIDAIADRLDEGVDVLTSAEVDDIDVRGRAMIAVNQGNALLNNALVQFVRCARVLKAELKNAEG
jgi:hypothetical protein